MWCVIVFPWTVRLTLLEGKKWDERIGSDSRHQMFGGDVVAVLVQCGLPRQRLFDSTLILVTIHMN
jgi:hypothetical protein